MNDHLPDDTGESPEQRELDAMWAKARKLRERVVELELEKSTVEAELERFQTTYLHRLGDLYLRLDQLRAELAELLANREPTSAELERKAKEARSKAESTADDVAQAREKPERPPFQPEEELKALYRQAAREMHPDLADTDEEAAIRHDYMIRLNAAYARGDEERIQELRVEWESKLLPPDDEAELGRALIRAIRVVDSLRRSIVRLQEEIARTRACELSRLRDRIEGARLIGEHPLARLQEDVEAQIADLEKRIRALRQDEEPGRNN